MYTEEEKQYLFLMYTMYANGSNNIPSYIHVSSYVVWRVHPSRKEHIYLYVSFGGYHKMRESEYMGPFTIGVILLGQRN